MKGFRMKLFNFFLIFLAVFALIFACGKNDETATAEQNSEAQQTETAYKNSEAQQTETAELIVDSRDEKGWYHDWNQGMAAAKKEKKPVLVDFYADWCKWCDVMDEKTFSNPEIQKIFDEDWITIRIDTQDTKTTGTFKDKTMTFRQMAGAFGVTGLPSYVFIDKKSEPVTVIPGYIPKEKFSKILDYMKNELYLDKVDFQEYVESNS